MSSVVNDNSDKTAHGEFDRAAQATAMAIKMEIDMDIGALRSIKSFHAACNFVERGSSPPSSSLR